MSSVFVKPRAGGRVRMPERNFRPMEKEGEFVPRNAFYERLIICGDVVVTEPPKPAPAAIAPPAETPATETPPAAEAAPAVTSAT